MDIAISETGPQPLVEIALGKADGTFMLVGSVQTVNTISAIALIDATSDRKADLVVGDGPNVVVYPGLGNGTFAAPMNTRHTFQSMDTGASLAAGDFNGDGLSDFVVSASRSGGGGIPTGAGKIYLFFGRSGGFFPEGVNSVDVSTSDYFFTGEAQDDGFGYTLTAVGDVNGDGFDDFAVGAPAADISGTGAIKDAGKVYVFFGFSP